MRSSRELPDKQLVLVIEDDKDIRESIVEILAYEGYRVLDAQNGRMGTEILDKIKPDLVLCDIMMNDMNGYQVLSYLKNRYPYFEIPLVYITALSERKDFRMAMEIGANDYITKPFTVDELLGCVRAQLGKSNAIGIRILSEIEKLEKSVSRRLEEMNDQIIQKEVALGHIKEENIELEKNLSSREKELAEEAMKVIEINNTLQNIEKSIAAEMQRRDISDQEKNTLMKLRSRINKKNLLVDNWTVFQMQFSKTHPGFLPYITSNFPFLSPMEITMACAIAINMSTDQMARLFNIMPESIRKNKYRLKQKMNLSHDENLRTYINQIMKEP
jgi:DNA-binding response OmpR family regulator/DNA-binding CsgD family transcriptional regulator